MRRRFVGALVAVYALAGLACRGRGSESGEAPDKSAPPKDAVVLRISYGSEKKGWITAAVDAFQAKRPTTSAGKPIHVEAVAEGSAESMEAILAGQSDAHVWSPASSLL